MNIWEVYSFSSTQAQKNRKLQLSIFEVNQGKLNISENY